MSNDDENGSTHSFSSDDSIETVIDWKKYSFDENQKDKILFSVLELIKTDVLMELSISTAKDSINIDNSLFSKKLKITRTDDFFRACDELKSNEFSEITNFDITSSFKNKMDTILEECSDYSFKHSFSQEDSKEILSTQQFLANCKVVKFISNDIGNIIEKGSNVKIDKYTFYKDFRNCSLLYSSETTGYIEYSYSVCDDKKINQFDVSRNVTIGTFELL
jgi:hypothetical protein